MIKWEWNYVNHQRSKSLGAVSARPQRNYQLNLAIYTDCYKSTPKESDTAHWRKKIHNCAECQKSFGWPGILKRHMETHNRERIFYCVQCKKSFGSAGHLNQQMLTHSGEKMHICSECKKSFGRAGTLKTHMLIHSGEKTHTCSENREQRTAVETSRNCACQDFHNCPPIVILVMPMMIHTTYDWTAPVLTNKWKLVLVASAR